MALAGGMPSCRRCGNYHWYFVKCEDLEARKQKQKGRLDVRWPDMPDGYREWGDRLDTIERIGGSHNLVSQRKKE